MFIVILTNVDEYGEVETLHVYSSPTRQEAVSHVRAIKSSLLEENPACEISDILDTEDCLMYISGEEGDTMYSIFEV